MTRRYDLPFEQDSTSRFVPWILSLMVFLSLLSLSLGMSLNNLTENWQNALSGKITLEIPYKSTIDQTLDERVSAAIDVLHTLPEITSVTILGDQDTKRLLEPFLGTDLPLADLPLPQLIAIDLKKGSALDLDHLQKNLKSTIGDVKIDDHGYWMKDIQRLSSTIEHLCLFLIILILSISTIVIIYATRMGLAIHFNVIELLHIMGAPDTYIASQFRRHMSFTAIKGSFIGCLGVFGCFLIFVLLTHSSYTAFMPTFTLHLEQLLLLLVIPVIVIGLTSISAYLTVVKTLRTLS